MAARVVARSRLVRAKPAEVFAILADPSEHCAIDGSGMVRRVCESSGPRLSLGARFEMQMKQAGSPYRIVNEVVEFDEPNVIAWQVHPGRRLRTAREFLVGGHRWRYRLTATNEGTLVHEEFDYSGARSPWVLHLLRFPTRNAAAIERTLDALAARFA